MLRIRTTVLEDEDYGNDADNYADNDNNGGGGCGGDGEAIYVQSVKINGQDWKKNWFEHGDVMVRGGTIEFVLGREMKEWGGGGVLPLPPGHAKV